MTRSTRCRRGAALRTILPGTPGQNPVDIGQSVGRSAGAALAGLSAVMTARARQQVPVKTIAVLYTQSPHSLFVLKSSGITSFKGLEGKKISITPGNSHKFYFPKVAEKSGFVVYRRIF